VREDIIEWPLERPSEGRQYRMVTGETRRHKMVQNGHWREQVREESTVWSLERPGEERQHRMATGETR
jgi:hypothetical protein